MKYSITQFSKEVGVPRKTLRLWHNNGRLVQHRGADGKPYYTESDRRLVHNNFGMPFFGKKLVYDNNWIDFSSVPTIRFSEKMDWKKAADNQVDIKFLYNNIQGVMKIISANNNRLEVVYDNSEKTISTASILDCNLGHLTDTICSSFRLEEGQRIENEKFKISILKRYRNEKYNKKVYDYYCYNCECVVYAVEEYYILDSITKCPVCQSRRCVRGVNDIETTDPWMLDFFFDSSIARNNTHGSKRKVKMKCPICGRNKKKRQSISTLYRTHSIGCTCGDGYSYPNKFMFSVLEQLKMSQQIEHFEKEWSPKWIDKKRFDFLVIQKCEKRFVIEMDGGIGHGNRVMDESISVEKTIEVDNWKDEQARQKGIEVVRIPSDPAEKTFLQLKIMEYLNTFFSFEVVDWDQADKFAISNLVKTVCEFYEQNKPITTKEVAKQFHIDPSTVMNYINKGMKHGWVKYDYELLKNNMAKGSKYGAEASKRRIARYSLEGQYEKEYDSIVSASEDMGVSTTAIANCCKGITKKSADHIWRYANEVIAGDTIEADLSHKIKGKPVDCYSTNGDYIESFPNAILAATKYNEATINGIRKCCKGRKDSSGGFCWKYSTS